MAYTTDDLLVAVKRDYILPVDQFSDVQLLAIGDEQLLEHLAPLLVAVNEAYFRETIDQSLTASLSSYALPRHAMWNALHDVCLVDSDGTRRELERIETSDFKFTNPTTAGMPTHFYLDHDRVILLPAPGTSEATTYTLRMWIYRRPNRMVLTTAAAAVSSIAAATGVVTYTAAPPATFTATSAHDAFSAVSPFRRVAEAMTATAASGSTQTFPGPRTLGYDGVTVALTIGALVTGGTSAAYGVLASKTATTLTLTGVSGTFQDNEAITDTTGGAAVVNGTLTNALTATDALVPGSYVCLRDETVFPAVPIELHSALKDLIGKSTARTRVDGAVYQAAVGEIVQAAAKALGAVLSKRVHAKPKNLSLLHSPFVRHFVGRGGGGMTSGGI